MLFHFALRVAVSEIHVQGQQKTEMHRMIPNWTWRLNSQKYPILTKHSPLGPKFWSVSLYDQRFPRYRTFYSSPLTTMLNVPKKNKKKMPQIPNLKFHNSLSIFGRGPPQEYAWFLGSEPGAYFQRRCRLKFLLPYGPMLTKTKKNRKK